MISFENQSQLLLVLLLLFDVFVFEVVVFVRILFILFTLLVELVVGYVTVVVVVELEKVVGLNLSDSVVAGGSIRELTGSGELGTGKIATTKAGELAFGFCC